jgi:hypothetical protein
VSAEPRKARFPAQPKMRPNEILKSLLRLLIFCKWKHLSLFMGPSSNPQCGFTFRLSKLVGEQPRKNKNLFDFFDFAVIYISFGF